MRQKNWMTVHRRRAVRRNAQLRRRDQRTHAYPAVDFQKCFRRKCVTLRTSDPALHAGPLAGDV